MKIVAMECGGPITELVAVETWGDNAEVAAQAQISQPRALSRLVMATLDALLTEAGWKLEELDGLAIGIGPGSWTSLRIGLSTFKTLAQTLQIPLAGVPTFDALAAAAYRARLESAPRRKKSKSTGISSQIILALAPCRPGQLYGKVFEMSAEYVSPSQGEWIADVKTHVDAAYSQGMASEIEPPLLLCGDGAADAAQWLEGRGERYEVAEIPLDAIALEIALAGAEQMVRGEASNPLEVAPLYLAPSHAERHLAAQSGGVLSS